MSGTGDCYEVAGRNAVLHEHLSVVHATVVGGLTPRHGHAWNEWEEGGITWCLDQSNGNDVMLPAALYYELGQVEDVRRYTRQEAMEKMLFHRHFGPWEGVDAPA